MAAKIQQIERCDCEVIHGGSKSSSRQNASRRNLA
jgi:hypothetical protein